jgi:hypothetical protein
LGEGSQDPRMLFAEMSDAYDANLKGFGHGVGGNLAIGSRGVKC